MAPEGLQPLTRGLPGGGRPLTGRRPPPEPVVLAPFHANTEMRIRTARAALLRDHGDARVHLTSSNSFSEGAVEASLAEYLAATPSGGRANESFYLFGPPTDARLAALVAAYEFPNCGGAWCRPSNLAASFGVAEAAALRRARAASAVRV